MLRALDPYHRIRAAVAAIFVATVAAMALMTVERPVRRGGGPVVAPAVVAPPVVAPGVASAGVASGRAASAGVVARRPVQVRGGSAGSSR